MTAATSLHPGDLAAVKAIRRMETQLAKIRQNPDDYEDGVQTELRNRIRIEKKELDAVALAHYEKQSKILPIR